MSIRNAVPGRLLIYAAVFGLALSCSVLVPTVYGEPAAARSKQETIRLGERIYRDGILPSGEPVMAFVKGDLPVAGTAFSCVSCHMRSGLGSIEGGVFTPPTNGLFLYRPFRILFKGLEQKYFPFPDRRPAYSDASLAEVIRSGESPAGVLLNDVMPRYLLEDEDMSVLVAYLKTLSSEHSPGVSDTTLRFATVIAEDSAAEERAAMLKPLQQYISIKNSQADAYRKPSGKKSRLMAENMLFSKELSTRNLTLSVWSLKGAPETWRAQLDEYYRREPVFALLGGISGSGWQPVHRFSEENGIPCLLPQTDLPDISGTGWYTLYQSKGYFQEGEAAARYLNGRSDITGESRILQIARDSREGDALAGGFERTWQDLEHHPPATLRLTAGEKISRELLEVWTSREKPAAILLWDGPDVRQILEMISNLPNRPGIVMVSSRYLGEYYRSLPDKVRDFTYITYPYSFAKTSVRSSMGTISAEDDTKWSVPLHEVPPRDNRYNAPDLSSTITRLLTMALMDMGGNYYRDNFLDVLGMIPDQPSQAYARLSFGPGQRYASKGCYIVQISRGSDPELVRKSAWVIH